MAEKVRVYIAGHSMQRPLGSHSRVPLNHIPNLRELRAMEYVERVQQEMGETEHMYGYSDKNSLVFLQLASDLTLQPTQIANPDGFIRLNFGLGSIHLTDIIESGVAVAQEHDSDVVYISPDFNYEASRYTRAPLYFPVDENVVPGVDVRSVQSYVRGPVVFSVDHRRKERSSEQKKSKIIIPTDIGKSYGRL